jgi:hypothetical protein
MYFGRGYFRIIAGDMIAAYDIDFSFYVAGSGGDLTTIRIGEWGNGIPYL